MAPGPLYHHQPGPRLPAALACELSEDQVTPVARFCSPRWGWYRVGTYESRLMKTPEFLPLGQLENEKSVPRGPSSLSVCLILRQ